MNKYQVNFIIDDNFTSNMKVSTVGEEEGVPPAQTVGKPFSENWCYRWPKQEGE
jgi:hypothetical protein